MTTKQTDRLDFIGVDKCSGEVVMTIVDTDEWSSDIDYLRALQEKLNRYIQFWESGDAVATYPEAKGRDVRIDIITRFPLREASGTTTDFLRKARVEVERVGLCLCLRTLTKDGLPGVDQLPELDVTE